MTTPTIEAREHEFAVRLSEFAVAAYHAQSEKMKVLSEVLNAQYADALRSLAASATQVPQGWKLVPVEADDTMKQAGIDVAPSGLLEIRGQLRNRASWSTEECAEVYRAMIEKSPPAPQAATQGEAVAGYWEVPAGHGNWVDDKHEGINSRTGYSATYFPTREAADAFIRRVDLREQSFHESDSVRPSFKRWSR